MKTTTTVEVKSCDICGKADTYDSCFGCGKDLCWRCCDNKKAVRYSHGVHIQGSGDGYYCLECDKRLTDDPLHKSYVQIKQIRDEAERFHEAWDARRKVAEAECKRLYEARCK